jgi:hypothetical protein
MPRQLAVDLNKHDFRHSCRCYKEPIDFKVNVIKEPIDFKVDVVKELTIDLNVDVIKELMIALSSVKNQALHSLYLPACRFSFFPVTVFFSQSAPSQSSKLWQPQGRAKYFFFFVRKFFKSSPLSRKPRLELETFFALKKLSIARIQVDFTT